MARYEPRVADVLEDKTLNDKHVVDTPINLRRNARGIVLSHKVSFSKGGYSNVKNLKKFFKTLIEGRASKGLPSDLIRHTKD